MICQSCGRELEAGSRFCPVCGASTSQPCPACGTALPDDARFCPRCGRAVAPAAAADPTAAAEPAAQARERKIATIVFADVVGYTRLNEGYDPELVQSLVSAVFERLSREIERYEGMIEKFAGDAVLALFGVPSAHEDDPERAVRAALEMQSAMAELAAEMRARGRPELELRIGIETGEVLVELGRVAGERDRLVTGDPVNVAARLQGIAAPGAVLVGPRTYAATRELMEYEEVEPLELKGKALPVPAWRAVRVRTRRGGERAPLGLEAPLIGRDEELGLLKETVRRMAVEGRPHMVTVIGSAGVGKSRLTWELEKYLDGLPEAYHWRKGRCLSYGQPSLGGLIEVVRADAKVHEDDDEATVRRRLADRLAELGLADDAQTRSALEVLLGASSEAAPNRDALFESIRRYVEAVARLAPLVLVTEDIHWADDGFLDLLDFLGRWAEAPMLLLSLARHELLERRPNWGGGVANSATIMLEPLAAGENEALVDALLPGSLPAAFKQRIAAVAEGNPLFCEEIVRMLIDRGIARRTDAGWELLAPVEELQIPGSVQALLAARLDSLPALEKRVAQAAAVVGRVFWDAVLAHVVAGASPQLDRLLRGLRAKELVVPREPSSLAESREFGFRHVLIRDVAYESVPKAERAAQHLAVAQWAEGRLAAREDELVEMLASHYRSALAYREEMQPGTDGELADLRRSVYEYALRAGRRARELWEGAAATDWFAVALEQAERLDLPPVEQGRTVLEYLEQAKYAARVDDTLAVARRGAALLAPLSTDKGSAEVRELLGRIEAHVAQLVFSLGRADEARELFRASLARFAAEPPSAVRAHLLARLGWLTWRAFSAAEAVPILERALAEARAVGSADSERVALHDLATAMEYSGRVGEGVEMMRRSFEMAREAGDQTLMFRCYINLPALLGSITWEVDEAVDLVREGIERARRGGQRFFAAFLASNLASWQADSGNFDEAHALCDEAIRLGAELGDENLIGLAHGVASYVWLRQGRPAEAAAHWQEAKDHGSDEPQGNATFALTEGLFAWPRDRATAVTVMATHLHGAPRADAEARQLLRMAMRAGELAATDAALASLHLDGEQPRLKDDRRWREALRGEPSSAAGATVREVADRYLAIGMRMVAADGYADAALIAARGGAAEAEELARRSLALYYECGAQPLLADPLEETRAALAVAARR